MLAPSIMHGKCMGSARIPRTASSNPPPFRCLRREIVLQHRTVADLALAQTVQRLVDLGHGEHLHHRLDAVVGTEVEHAGDRGRRTRGGVGDLLLPQDQRAGLHRSLAAQRRQRAEFVSRPGSASSTVMPWHPPDGDHPCLAQSFRRLKSQMFRAMVSGCCVPTRNCSCLLRSSSGSVRPPSTRLPRSRRPARITSTGPSSISTCRLSPSAIRKHSHW